MRVDKLTLSALEATLRLYLEPRRALKEIPVLMMLTEPAEHVEIRARSVAAALRPRGIDTDVVPSTASVGGGAFPTAQIPSHAIAIKQDAAWFEERLRTGEPAVIGRISEGQLLLDMRSVMPGEGAALTAAIVKASA
jgi:L-seryl-tRNA(Ser) seleniumtransferase